MRRTFIDDEITGRQPARGVAGHTCPHRGGPILACGRSRSRCLQCRRATPRLRAGPARRSGLTQPAISPDESYGPSSTASTSPATMVSEIRQRRHYHHPHPDHFGWSSRLLEHTDSHPRDAQQTTRSSRFAAPEIQGREQDWATEQLRPGVLTDIPETWVCSTSTRHLLAALSTSNSGRPRAAEPARLERQSLVDAWPHPWPPVLSSRQRTPERYSMAITCL